VTVDKPTLRRDYLAKRALLPAAERQAAAEKLATLFFGNFTIGTGKIIAGYYPIKNEMDCLGILRAFLQRGHLCALPCVTGLQSPLVFRSWDETTPLEKKQFGICEPQSAVVIPDVVLTPLLAFDTRGYRLGYGAGLYDRSFALLPDTLKIGLAYDCQNYARVPHDPTDVRLDYILTESHIYKTGEKPL
jgi:5-formyltetrahydrofolate cyclo-ligase